jgi:hypothetical protein
MAVRLWLTVRTARGPLARLPATRSERRAPHLERSCAELSKLGGPMSGAERPDGEAPKPPQITLEMSLNHGHPRCTPAPSLTLGLKHPSCGAGRVLSGSYRTLASSGGGMI